MTQDTNRLNPDTERLNELLDRLSLTQVRFVVARLETNTDKEAAEIIGISAATVRNWSNKPDVDEAVRNLHKDGMVTALHIRRRNLAKAMAVKSAGLDANDEKIRQSVATEIIEWELGKAVQKQEHAGPDGGAIPIDLFSAALKRVYNDGDSGD